MTDLLERWLTALVTTSGLTSLGGNSAEARRSLLDDALRGLEVVAPLPGAIVDVGSGGGTPGIPLAASLPSRQVTLVEANRRKCDFLQAWAAELPNLAVVAGRAEEQPNETYSVAVAKALAPPHVAAEWCLPLVREGGTVVLWVGPTADLARVAATADRVGGQIGEAPAGLLVIHKIGPTPPGFPRRPGMAKKRPLT